VRRARGAGRLAPFAAPRVCALLAAPRLWVLLAALVLGFSACTSSPPYEQRMYVVRAGDTLFSIAWQHGVDQRDLARWNGIKNPDLIQVGQRLRLSPPDTGAKKQASASKPSSAPATRGSAPATGATGGPGASKPSPTKPAPEPALPNLPPPQWSWPVDG